MSDEATAPETQDQPTDAPEAVEATPEAPEVTEDSFDGFDLSSVPEDADREWFGRRVSAFQKDYSRKTQALAEERTQVQAVVEAIRDPDHPAHEEVLAQLGLPQAQRRVSEDEELDFIDPEDRIAALERHLEQQEQSRQQSAAQEAELDYLADEIESIQNREDREFSEREIDLIATYAAANRDQRGAPDVEGAVAALKELEQAQQQRYLDSKRAPRRPGAGLPAVRDVDLSNRDARLEAAEQIAAAVYASDSV